VFELEYKPARQGVQSEEPATAETLPGEQKAQEDIPERAWNWPAEQRVQDDEPADEEKVPETHTGHSVMPGSVEENPIAQSQQ